MQPLTDEANKFYQEKKSATYGKKDLVLIMTKTVIK